MVRVPLLVPLAVGSKKIPIEQLEPAAMLFPQALSKPKSTGLAATEKMLMLTPLVFVTVTL